MILNDFNPQTIGNLSLTSSSIYADANLSAENHQIQCNMKELSHLYDHWMSKKQVYATSFYPSDGFACQIAVRKALLNNHQIE